MNKYICNECGMGFDEPYEYQDEHGLEHGPYEKWSVCPCCHSSDYREVYTE